MIPQTTPDAPPVREPIDPRTPRRLGAVSIGESALRALLGVPEGLVLLGMSLGHYGRTLRLVLEGEDMPLCHEACEPADVPGSWWTETVVVDGKAYRRLEWTP